MKTEKRMASLMFADIVGYSKMMGMDQAKMLAVLDECKVIIEPLVELFNGKIIKWTGDEIFCEFPLNENAADCALAIQTKLSEYNKDNKGFKVIMRIGIHSGEVAISTGDRHGNTVNVASRIEKQSPEGGVAVSGNVYSELKSYPRFAIKKMKAKKLKNIDFKYDLYLIQTGFEQNIKKSYVFRSISILIVVIIIFSVFQYDNWTTGTDAEKPTIIENTNSLDNIPLQATQFLNQEKVKKFIGSVFNIKNSEGLLEFLENEKNNGVIKVGNKVDFYDTDKKLIITLKNDLVSDVSLKLDNAYISTKDNKVFNSLAERYKDHRMIWVHLY